MNFEQKIPEKPDKKISEEGTLVRNIKKHARKISLGVSLLSAVSGVQLGHQPHKAEKYNSQDHHQDISRYDIEATEHKLDQLDFDFLCQSDPRKAIITASLYDEPWVGQYLEIAVAAKPWVALKYADRYSHIPEADRLLEKALDSTSVYAWLDYASKWNTRPFADKFLEKIKNEDFPAVLEHIADFKSTPKLINFIRECAEDRFARGDRFILFSHMRELQEFDWGIKLIEAGAKIDPYSFLSLYYNIDTFGEEIVTWDETLRKLSIQTCKDNPDIAVQFVPNTPGAEWISYDEMLEEGYSVKKFSEELRNSDSPILQKASKWRAKYKYNDLVTLAPFIEQSDYDEKQLDLILKNPDYRSSCLTNIMLSDQTNKKSVERAYSDLALRQVAIINFLHEKPDNERFASLESLSAEKTYLIINYAEQEIFTSTFNGCFNRLLEKMEKEKLNGFQLIQKVKHLRLRDFIRACSEFNRLDDFFATMTAEQKNEILVDFIKNFKSQDDPLREAVSIAEVINSTSDSKILTLFGSLLHANVTEATKENNTQLAILNKMIGSVLASKNNKNDSWLQEIEKEYRLPSLAEIKSAELFNESGYNVQQYFFYNDDDGKASYKNFLSEYADKSQWQISDQKTHITITSLRGVKKMKIFANKPEFVEEGQKAVSQELKDENVKTLVVVHRGHSFHVDETIRQIPEIAKIVSLGSCGGYRSLNAVLRRAPRAHIISTKGTGSKFVNDPLLKTLNDEIILGHDINWQKFWSKARAKIGNKDLFNNYVAPDKNFGATFIKAYETATSSSQTANSR
jgi:hypothetical protein